MTKRHSGPCATCHPPIEPELGRQGSVTEHVGARFQDGQRAYNEGKQYSVTLDGEDVTTLAVEAMAGQPGSVVMEPNPNNPRKVADMACRGASGAAALRRQDPRYVPPEHLRTHLRKGHVIIRLTDRTPRV